MASTRAFVAFGANLGDAARAYALAQADINSLEGCTVEKASSLYRSAPVGVSNHPDYLNAVIAVQTTLPAGHLLDALLALETHHGRVRSETVNPRTMDLDLLLYGDHVLESPALTLPHPRMHLRAFVLMPLAELAPDLIIPLHGPLQGLLPLVADQRIERLGN